MRRSAGLALALAAVMVTCVVVAVLMRSPAVPSPTGRLAGPATTPSSTPSSGPSTGPSTSPSTGPSTGPSPPSATPEGAPATSPVDAAPAPAARPVGLRIPSIGVSARVTRLDLNPDRTVEVPSDPAQTGWYERGPAPGDVGSAVILGHVDSDAGPAVFHRLRQLQPGDRVGVDGADGSTVVFRVHRIKIYANARFPAAKVYAAGGGGRRLNLVTCGGTFDAQDGYQANLVVYTRRI